MSQGLRPEMRRQAPGRHRGPLAWLTDCSTVTRPVTIRLYSVTVTTRTARTDKAAESIDQLADGYGRGGLVVDEAIRCWLEQHLTEA